MNAKQFLRFQGRLLAWLTFSVLALSHLPSTGAQTLISTGAVWRFLDNGQDQGTAWREPEFDDSAWAAGPAQLGYGDGDEATVVSFGANPTMKNVTTYFRRSFVLADAASVTELRGLLLQDDGSAVYLNGVEVFRGNLSADDLSFSTLATVAAENQTVGFTVSPSLLVDGVNVIAVEIHQVNAASSDLSFDLELVGKGGSDPHTARVFRCVGWGNNSWHQLNIPGDLTNAVAIAAGEYHSMALRADGTVALWGGNGADYEDARVVPPGLNNVAAISANWGTSMALKHDGAVVPWGVGIGDPYDDSLLDLNTIAISAGGFFALALRVDGTVVA